MTPALIETQLLLEALRIGQTAADWQAACDRAGVDRDHLAVRAIVLGLAPQLHQRLKDWRLPIPPRATAKLAVTYQAQAQRNAGLFDQLADVLRACAGRGLRAIALKGVHLAALIYPDPALRPMNDIDLLFEPEALPEAEALLEALGYGGKHKAAGSGPGVVKHTSTFKRPGAEAATPNPYLSAEAGRLIEPHTSLEESWFGLRVDITPGVRERAVETYLAGQPCRVLAREDLLLHLCVHFCFHVIAGSPAMVQLVDLAVVTAAGGVDWPTFTARAAERRAAPYALAALSLADRLLSAPVGQALPDLARSTPPHLRARAARLDLATLLARTQQKPLVTLTDRLRRGLSDRAEAARWAPDWRGRWRVWQTALRLHRTDTAQLILKTVLAKNRIK